MLTYIEILMASSSADAALSPTLVGKSVVIGVMTSTRFQLCQRSLTKLHVLSEKPRLCLKSVAELYAGKSGF